MSCELTGGDEGAKVDAGKKGNCSWPNPLFLLTVAVLPHPPLPFRTKGAERVQCVANFLLVFVEYKEATVNVPPYVG